MLNIKKTILFIAILLPTISLAATCPPGDTSCKLSQKKLQAMDKVGIKPMETSDIYIPDPKSTKKKEPFKLIPFQISKPDGSLTKTDQNTQKKPPRFRLNPGLNLSPPANQNPQGQEAQPQQTEPTSQPQKARPKTSIYR
jgi:hypothetical protein